MTTSFVRLTVLGSILPLLAACVTVGPDYQKPNVLTLAGWNSKADKRAPQLGDWWKNLKDPVLDQLIADGIAGSPDVATAKAKVRQTRANYTSAGGALYPQLDGSGSFTRSDSGTTLASNQSSMGLKPNGNSIFSAATGAVWKQPTTMSNPQMSNCGQRSLR
ncbi:TolC family protein [Brucella sp. JSBI001]|uniref:TolC family protein n=1 Tax=Brucella sp. JSBI001 TaxID=2886044 RepID=UPI00222E3BA5|nr:TolC family protein [Brucella sp. JSBI001]UZD71032.1 TolC family protein [Brucella sp. JSBI001]